MEIWDAYLMDGTLADGKLVRGEPIPEGLYHLVCEILVRHADGDYLLMQRDLHKDGYPGCWEATAGGSALRGEDPLTCARRELKEETGVEAGVLTEIGRCVTHHTIYHQFLCTTDCDRNAVTLQAGETIAHRWLTEKEFIAFVNSAEMIDVQRMRYLPYLQQMGYVQE
ncbi:MAG: NUDIX domain-containing protein [Aristaeellaceae bacterium]